jgi:hypothetical protein
MKLSWAVGELFLSTFYEFWSHSMTDFLWSWTTGIIIPSFGSVLLTFERDRYRAIPSFGRDTIRRFSANCSELKKMAARDFENLLQVCYGIIF